MRLNRYLLPVALFAALLFLFPRLLVAQSVVTGALNGAVTDPSACSHRRRDCHVDQHDHRRSVGDANERVRRLLVRARQAGPIYRMTRDTGWI